MRVSVIGKGLGKKIRLLQKQKKKKKVLLLLLDP